MNVKAVVQSTPCEASRGYKMIVHDFFILMHRLPGSPFSFDICLAFGPMLDTFTERI